MIRYGIIRKRRGNDGDADEMIDEGIQIWLIARKAVI